MSLRFASIVVGLAVALGLAVLATHPRLREVRQRAGLAILLSSGLPFLALGALFRTGSIGILTPDVLRDLQPAFEFGLGWIGFAVGLQLDMRKFEKLPLGLDAVVAAESLPPMALVALLCGGMLWLLGVHFEGGQAVREALVLAACAAPSAHPDLARLVSQVGNKAAESVRDATSLDDLSALAILGLIAVFFRPKGTETLWSLPASAWLLVTLGLGVVLGVVTYMLVRKARHEAEETALLIGAVALSAGAAGYLALSVPVVCTIAGALVANLPHPDLRGLRKTMRDVERPLYMVFLLIAGASWHPGEWQGWVLALTFVAARVLGKGAGSWVAVRVKSVPLPPARTLWAVLVPQSPISIVVIVAASTTYRGWLPDPVRWAINAVIVGSVLTELLSRGLSWSDRQRGTTSAPEPEREVSP